jgi:hypothetical protein
MRRAEFSLADRDYLMDIPMGALMVAPTEFFSRFGKTFSETTREEVLHDLKRNVVFCAVPSDDRRKARTPYVVRRIDSSRVKDALSGKLSKEILNPIDHAGQFLDSLVPKKVESLLPDEKVNVYKCTMPELLELAKKHKVANAAKLPRKALTTALIEAMSKPSTTDKEDDKE